MGLKFVHALHCTCDIAKLDITSSQPSFQTGNIPTTQLGFKTIEEHDAQFRIIWAKWTRKEGQQAQLDESLLALFQQGSSSSSQPTPLALPQGPCPSNPLTSQDVAGEKKTLQEKSKLVPSLRRAQQSQDEMEVEDVASDRGDREAPDTAVAPEMMLLEKIAGCLSLRL